MIASHLVGIEAVDVDVRDAGIAAPLAARAGQHAISSASKPSPAAHRPPARGSDRGRPRSAGPASSFHLHPSSFTVGKRDRVAEHVLPVAGGEGRIVRLRRRPARRDRRVDGAVQLAERVREPLGVRRRAGACAGSLGAQQAGIAQQDLVGLVAVAEPELLVPLGVPRERACASRRPRSAASSCGRRSPARRRASRACRRRSAAGCARGPRSSSCASVALDVAGVRVGLHLADRPAPHRDRGRRGRRAGSPRAGRSRTGRGRASASRCRRPRAARRRARARAASSSRSAGSSQSCR